MRGALKLYIGLNELVGCVTTRLAGWLHHHAAAAWLPRNHHGWPPLRLQSRRSAAAAAAITTPGGWLPLQSDRGYRTVPIVPPAANLEVGQRVVAPIAVLVVNLEVVSRAAQRARVVVASEDYLAELAPGGRRPRAVRFDVRAVLVRRDDHVARRAVAVHATSLAASRPIRLLIVRHPRSRGRD